MALPLHIPVQLHMHITEWRARTMQRAGAQWPAARIARFSLRAGLPVAWCTALVLFLSGCDDGAAASKRASPAASAATNETHETTQPTILLTPENLAIVERREITEGPGIAGALAPEQESVIRAEAAGSVLAVLAEQGEAVTRGQLLARIEDTTLQDQLHSAKSALRSAQQAAQLAARNLERVMRLAQAGAMAERDVEAARLNQSTSDAQVAEAATRVALVEKQLAKTRVHSPIDGVVSLRPVNGGDVVSIGSVLFSIVDPGRMQLIAAVPAARIGSITPGAPVRFHVQGYADRLFNGVVSRISPSADPATRQVIIYVTVPNITRSLVSGLYAEGRVDVRAHNALTAPLAAVDFSSAMPRVLRLRNGRAQPVAVQVGIRDERNERVELIGDVQEGDTLLTGVPESAVQGAAIRIQRPDASRR